MNADPVWPSELGVERNVVFYNRFVAPDKLVGFIGAADIYIVEDIRYNRLCTLATPAWHFR